MGTKDQNEAFPIDRIESFTEIKLEDDGRDFTDMAAVNQVSGIHDIFRDASAREETGLVCVNKRVDVGNLAPSNLGRRTRRHD
jgi:hypothetical protein